MIIGILLLLAAIAAYFWKKREFDWVPVEKQTTIKPWVVILLLILALLCLSSCSNESKNAKPSQADPENVRFTKP
jgi:hypothetical protein